MEEKSGLSRANIRYYEQEGLLAPTRLDNGYRDYSDADLVALQKVQLLRQLGLTPPEKQPRFIAPGEPPAISSFLKLPQPPSQIPNQIYGTRYYPY